MVRKKGAAVVLAVLFGMLASCSSEADDEPVRANVQAYGTGYFSDVSTDKAAYRPGETVRFDVKLQEKAGLGELIVQYRHLADLVGRTTLRPKPESRRMEWEWRPPSDDYRGYLVELFWKSGGEIKDHRNIAIDVSSDWGRFPRYGYLAEFGQLSGQERLDVVKRLNRFHLNGVQFYDWQWKHHMPLKLDESGTPAGEWRDIANRTIKRDTVQGYIGMLHQRGIKAMNYNLLFGAYDPYERDGVKPEWGLYRDPLHENQDRHHLPASWASDLLIMNPGNPEWLDYLFREEKKVFHFLSFDGWHVDQLGNRGSLFDYFGQPVSLMLSYGDMLKKANQAIPADYVMNAVGQYGQILIAQAPVKFLYSELWDSHPLYADLKRAIDENAKYSRGKLNSVLAAYINYDLADRADLFNAPGVLYADAVIFASGGAHMEIGENLLAKEYFPNRNLRIPPDLEKQLTVYYDFLTAYENVLRDELAEDGGTVAQSATVRISARAEAGKVWSFAKRKGNRRIVHLLNFINLSEMEWRDGKGKQAEPQTLKNLTLSIRAASPVSRVWMATPDALGGSPAELPFTFKNGQITVTIPVLKYWDMLVLE